MRIQANGQEVVLERETNVSDLLVLLKVEMPLYVTVQINEELIERENFDTTIVKEHDTVEFLYFMGGGCYGTEQ